MATIIHAAARGKDADERSGVATNLRSRKLYLDSLQLNVAAPALKSQDSAQKT